MSPIESALQSLLVVVAISTTSYGLDFPEPPSYDGANDCTTCNPGPAFGDTGCQIGCGCEVASGCGDACCGPACPPPCPIGNCCRLCGTPCDFCDAFTNQGPCDPSSCCAYHHSTCDMPQHMAYYPEAHGYYYFKPYNYLHLQPHQQFVASFGGDIRNPYDTSILDNLSPVESMEAIAPGEWRPAQENPFDDDANGRYDPTAPGESMDEPMDIVP